MGVGGRMVVGVTESELRSGTGSVLRLPAIPAADTDERRQRGWRRDASRKRAARTGFFLFVVGGNADAGSEIFALERDTIYRRDEVANFTSSAIEVSHPAGQIRPLIRRFHTMVAYTP